MCISLRVKYLCACPILTKLEYSRHNFEKSSNIIFMKIRPVGAELFHEDRWTVGQKDTTKLTASFSNFSVAPKNLLQ